MQASEETCKQKPHTRIIKATFSMITIYTKSYCPYCHRAKALLDSLNFKYDEIDATTQTEKLEPAIKLSGIRTVPQIFVDGKFIGGCDDIHALHKKGQLLPLLK